MMRGWLGSAGWACRHWPGNPKQTQIELDNLLGLCKRRLPVQSLA
jgi:hypothetical protein